MSAATVVQVLRDLFYVLLHVLFYLWSLLNVTHRSVDPSSSSPSPSPAVNLVVVGGGCLRLPDEARHRALDPGAGRPWSDGHHRPGGDEVAEAGLMRECVAGPQWPDAGSWDSADGGRSAQDARTPASWMTSHLLFHPHLPGYIIIMIIIIRIIIVIMLGTTGVVSCHFQV